MFFLGPGSTIHCIYCFFPLLEPGQNPGQKPGQKSGQKSDKKSGQKPGQKPVQHFKNKYKSMTVSFREALLHKVSVDFSLTFRAEN